jgi:predicted XRE-type DNA-binding protein
MGFPDKKKLDQIKNLAEKLEPDFVISKDANQTDKIKYQLCQLFIVYMMDNKLTQSNLAEKLDLPQPRINEVLKCKIHLFTIDRLVEYYSKLYPNSELKLKDVS